MSRDTYSIFYSRKKFPHLPPAVELQKKQVGEVAVVELPSGIFFNLVTKKNFYDKPKYFHVWTCLKNLRAYLDSTWYKSLAFPHIACGLDGLNWKIIKFMLSYIFRDKKYKIYIYERKVNFGNKKILFF